MKCPGCNREIHDGAKFCPRCGTVISKRKKPQPVPVEEPAPEPVEEPMAETPAEPQTPVPQVTPSPELAPAAVVTTEPEIAPAVTPTPEIAPEPEVQPEEVAMAQNVGAPVPPPYQSELPPTPYEESQPPATPYEMPATPETPYGGGGSVPPPYMGGPQMQQPMPEYPQMPQNNTNKKLIWIAVACGAVALFCVLLVVLKFAGVFDSKETASSGYSTYKDVSGDLVDSAAVNDSAAVEVTEVTEIAVDTPSYSYGYYDESPSYATYTMGFSKGQNVLDGEMIHTDGRRFPYRLTFNYNPYGTPEITDAVYYNINYNSSIKCHVTEMYDTFVRLEGHGAGKDFILQFNGDDGHYEGDAWWGDLHQGTELWLR